LFLILSLAGALVWIFYQPGEVSGEISRISLADQTLAVDLGRRTLVVDFGPGTFFSDPAGQEIQPSYLKTGFSIAAEGKKQLNGRLNATEIKITREPNIIVYEPKVGDEVASGFGVQGIARVFENQFNWEVLNVVTSEKIVSGNAMADAPDIGLFGDFSFSVGLPANLADKTEILLRVFDYSARDGSEENIVEIPLVFSASKKEISVYFGNSRLDPETDCRRVFPVKRLVAANAPARPALEALLTGPNEIEKSANYFTSLPAGVKINLLKIENGTASVDFSEDLERGVGGSCRVAAIRSQIVETLKQFPSVQSVIISINGRTEDILQP